jgi:hypothetical protein
MPRCVSDSTLPRVRSPLQRALPRCAARTSCARHDDISCGAGPRACAGQLAAEGATGDNDNDSDFLKPAEGSQTLCAEVLVHLDPIDTAPSWRRRRKRGGTRWRPRPAGRGRDNHMGGAGRLCGWSRISEFLHVRPSSSLGKEAAVRWVAPVWGSPLRARRLEEVLRWAREQDCRDFADLWAHCSRQEAFLFLVGAEQDCRGMI